jgi:NTP pyrophosphatase (non-canonical NTP hydrolase)
MMNIYVASSWRNDFQPEVVKVLRKDGHRVYDFKEDGDGWGQGIHGPGGFHWSEIDPDWQKWPSDIQKYIDGLKNPRATEGFHRDMDALEQADACVMVMPCGSSASMEMGWAVGANCHVYVYIPRMREPDLMVKMADLVTADLGEIRSQLNKTSPRLRSAEQRRIGTWYKKNDGGGFPMDRLRRLRRELDELEVDIYCGNHGHAKEELADVAICLSVIADSIGCDLHTEVSKKMDINEARQWTRSEDGTLSHVKGTDPRELQTLESK